MSHLVVVRQGEEGVYRALRESLERAGRVTVIWDRRRGDRRSQGDLAVVSERRSGERRARPASTWASIGFVMAPLPAGASRR